MKTRVVRRAVLAVLCSLQAFGQVGVWKNHTSMQDVKGVARAGNTIWAATRGGLFAWQQGSESYTRYTSADGLQSTDLTAITIDKNGDVWTGAVSGIIHILTPSSGTWRYVSDIASTNQTNKRINSFSVYGDTVLISSNFGLSVLHVGQLQFGDTYTKFGSFTGNVRVAVSSAAIFEGKIWAAVSTGGSSRVASASLSLPNLLPPEVWTLQAIGSATTTVRSLATFNNKLYAGTDAGLFVLNGSSWTAVDALVGRDIVAMSASTNILAVAEAANIVDTLSVSNTVGRFGTQLPFAPNSITLSATDKPVIATKDGGVMTLEAAWTSHYPNGPASNQFLSVAVDADGNVWGGTGINGGGKGFYRYNGTAWRSFNRKNPPLPFDDYYRASVGCNGDVWISSWGRGVLLMPRGADRVDTANHFGKNVGMSYSVLTDTNFIVVGSTVCDGRGNLWMSVLNAADKRVLVVRKPDGRWSTLPVYINQERQLYITNIEVTRPFTVDASDNLWIASVTIGNKGVVSLNNKGSATDSVADFYLTTANGLPSNEVRTIVVDRDNDVWVGTDRGIGIILDPSNPTRSGGIASYKPLSGLVINAIAVDPLNQKWVATNEGALLLSRDGTQTIAQYNVANTNGKIIDNEIKDIAIDPKTGTVYFATFSGLASLTTTSVEPKQDFDQLTISPNPYRIPNPKPVIIDGLVQNSKIKILTIDGHVIRELQTPGGRIGFWDGKDEAGKDVASGIYLVIAYSETEKDKVGKGKVAVLRR